MDVSRADYDLVRALVGREDQVEHVLDCAVAQDQRQALDEAHAAYLEGRQAQRVDEAELGVAQHLERQV